MAADLRALLSCAGVGLGLLICASLGGGCKGKERPEWCAKLAPVPLAGKVSAQAAALGAALANLGVPESSTAHAGLVKELKKIETQAKTPVSKAAADQLALDLDAAAKAWRLVVDFDCGEPRPAPWEQEIRQIATALKSESRERDKNQQLAEEKKAADEKRVETERLAKVDACRGAALAPRGATRVALSKEHYSLTGGTRGGIVFYRKKGADWESDPLRLTDSEPGVVPWQADLVFSRDSAKCVDMADTVDGRDVKLKVCGRTVDVFTCDLRQGTLMGTAQIVLAPPEELRVRGSVPESAARHLATQLMARLAKLSWTR